IRAHDLHVHGRHSSARERCHCTRAHRNASTSNDSDSALSVVGDGAERAEIRLPLDRHHRLLFRVAVLAGGNDVAPRGSPAAAHRDDVIHREIAGPDPAAAVVADAVGEPTLPPRARTELTRLRALAPERARVDRNPELTHGPRAPPRAPPTRA